jgi:hypothetical protein
VTTTHFGPAAASWPAAPAMSAGVTTCQPSNADASSRLGVATVAYGRSRSIAATTPCRRPPDDSSTGSRTRLGRTPARALAATAAAASALASMPTFAAPGGMSSSTEVSWTATTLPGIGNTSATALVFRAVTAVTTETPYMRKAAKTFRSAWMPVPAPESELPIVMATAGRVGTWGLP